VIRKGSKLNLNSTALSHGKIEFDSAIA